MVGPELPSDPMQFNPFANILAVVVLPTPLTPVKMNAWANLFKVIAFDRVRTNASCPISASKLSGRYFRAKT
jgi:hypothetical protein